MQSKEFGVTEIFVFGSNLAGRHGKGAALYARKHHGAVYGKALGRMGTAYAIPTKDENLLALPLDRIRAYVDEFLVYATQNPDLKFRVTAIGTGLAGYGHEEIAPMFGRAPNNCNLPSEWAPYLQRAIDMPPKKSQGDKRQRRLLLGKAPRRRKKLR